MTSGNPITNSKNILYIRINSWISSGKLTKTSKNSIFSYTDVYWHYYMYLIELNSIPGFLFPSRFPCGQLTRPTPVDTEKVELLEVYNTVINAFIQT